MAMISPIVKPGKIHLGIETLRCPRCKFPNRVEITSDLPSEDWLTCAGCGYKALLDIRPILKKYGLPQGLSIEEKRDFSNHLQRDLKKM
jgi:DNA-directed RNA polymerase subunit RPC12/RpoP